MLKPQQPGPRTRSLKSYAKTFFYTTECPQNSEELKKHQLATFLNLLPMYTQNKTHTGNDRGTESNHKTLILKP